MEKVVIMKRIIVMLISFAAISAIPTKPNTNYSKQKVKEDDVLRSQYVAGDGKYVSDLWVSAEDVEQSKKYNPVFMNKYHLFTRENPSISQQIPINNKGLLIASNFYFRRRIIILINGWQNVAMSALNTVLVPAFLGAEDVNVFVVDWSQGSGSVAYPVAVLNTPVAGEAVANFLLWLSDVSKTNFSSYHIVGHNLGAHMAGIIGRELFGMVAYITGLDPAFSGWVSNDDKFQPTDAQYTEVIHTNAGLLGFPSPLADSDFYPNGGVDMPGCVSQECDSFRSIHYFAESIKSGGFTGVRCVTFAAAMAEECSLPGTLDMGGLVPKHWQSGIFYLRTNAYSPFSRSGREDGNEKRI